MLILLLGTGTISTGIQARSGNRWTPSFSTSSRERKIQIVLASMRFLIQGAINGATLTHNLFKTYAKPYIVYGAHASCTFISDLFGKLARCIALTNENTGDESDHTEPYQYPEPSAPPIEDDEEYLFGTGHA